MVQNKILCTGDPILDIYIENNIMHHFNGGALNIYQNILALLENFWPDNPNDFMFAYPSEEEYIWGDIFNCYTIVRTSKETEGVPLATKQVSNIFYASCGIAEVISEFKPKILVMGDYNKGSLNDFCSDPDTILPTIKYGVVDSRYRSLDFRWLETCETKIWHATGTEYDEEWAKPFDYVFWTNGDKPVKLLKDGELLATLLIPNDTPVTNTCGSGDTFTAAISACLYAYDSATDKNMVDYGNFAIQVCQNVVSMPYTSTTTKRINKECTLQI